MNPNLTEILQTMDVPKQRLTDVGWLQRNLGFRNESHPLFMIAMTLLSRERV